MEFKTGVLTLERLKPIQKYLENDEITNIDWNGTELWLRDTSNRCYKDDNTDVDETYVNNLIANIANSKGEVFNQEKNILETANEELHIRVTAVHKSIAPNGNALSIRRTTVKSRFTYDSLIKSGYIKEKELNLLINCIIAGCNVVVGGIPEAGKTEFGKYLSQYIPDDETVVTIEDSAEWYYKKLKPKASCIALETNEFFSYRDAIKLCMKLNPKRILFTEVRSTEVKELVALWTSGVPGITTIHSGGYRTIPDRILNLLESRHNSEQIENDIFYNLDIGIFINKKKNKDKTATRYVDEIGFFDRNNNKNECIDYMIHQKNVGNTLPDKILKKMEYAGIRNPFELNTYKI